MTLWRYDHQLINTYITIYIPISITLHRHISTLCVCVLSIIDSFDYILYNYELYVIENCFVFLREYIINGFDLLNVREEFKFIVDFILFILQEYYYVCKACKYDLRTLDTLGITNNLYVFICRGVYTWSVLFSCFLNCIYVYGYMCIYIYILFLASFSLML